MFRDRKDAGQKLAEALVDYKGKDSLVLALPRGGVPVGFEIAKVLECTIDTIVVRKIGAPGNPEYALGAIAPRGVVLLDASREGLEEVIHGEEKELRRRIEKYKSGSYSGKVKPAVVFVVDDGVATGRTAHAALLAARAMYPNAELVFAVPVGALDSVRELQRYADKVVCLDTPSDFAAVGQWYERFDQTTDEEVVVCLEAASRR